MGLTNLNSWNRVSEIRRVLPAVIDQAAWSLSGLVLSIAIGRNLGPDALGAYAVAYAVLLGIGSLHNSLVLEPLVVLGPAKFEANLRDYAGNALLATLGSGLIAVPVGLALLFWQPSPTVAAIGAAISVSPITMTAWVARRIPYLDGNQPYAAIGSAVYTLATFCGLVIVVIQDRLSPMMAFWVIGAASLLQILAVGRLWRPSFASARCRAFWRRTFVEHWEYGRWVLASSAAFWVTSHGYTALIALLLGTADTGGLRSAQSLVAPAGLLFAALSLNYTPEFTRARIELGASSVKSRLVRLQITFIGFGLFLLGVAIPFASDVLVAVYGSEFRPYAWVLVALSALTAVQGWSAASMVALRSLEYPKGIFYAYTLAAAVVVVLGYPLGIVGGFPGIVVSMALSALALSSALQLVVRRRLIDA